MTKLVDTHPELARQWDKDKNVIDLKDARTKDKKKRWWIGDCGHNWDTATYSPNSAVDAPGFNHGEETALNITLSSGFQYNS